MSDPILGKKALPRPVLGKDLEARDRRRAVDANIGKLMELGLSAGDAIKALADADGSYEDALASVATPPTPEPEQAMPSSVDTRAIARQIQGGPPADPKASAMRDLAKEIRGY